MPPHKHLHGWPLATRYYYLLVSAVYFRVILGKRSGESACLLVEEEEEIVIGRTKYCIILMGNLGNEAIIHVRRWFALNL